MPDPPQATPSSPTADEVCTSRRVHQQNEANVWLARGSRTDAYEPGRSPPVSTSTPVVHAAGRWSRTSSGSATRSMWWPS